MRGRKPIPKNLHVLRGNPGRRPLKPEPEPENRMPSCPSFLKGEAQKEWRRISKLLYHCGLLTPVDRTALAAYCQTFSQWVEAQGHIAEVGMVVKGSNGPMQNPYLRIANRLLEQMQKLLVEFGMTPSSRSRIKIQPREEESEFRRFLNAKGT